jgi:hypothetical protein
VTGDPAGRERRSESALLAGCALAFALVGAVLLWPVLDGGFFADDWELWLADPRGYLGRAFFETRPYENYRPLQLVAVALSQSLFGYTTLPVHLANLGLHVALAVLVTRALLGFGASRAGAVLGGSYLCVSQLAASAVGGNDTMSLTLGTLAGSAALWWLTPSRASLPRPGPAAVAFAVSLLAKESSLGYLPLLAALVWLSHRSEAAGARRPVTWTVVFAVTALAYLALRSQAGGTLPDVANGEQMRLGWNVARNAALLAFAAVIPLPTTQVFLGAAARELAWPVAGGLSAAAVVALLCWGMTRAGKLAWLASLAAAAAVVLAPVLLLHHVSELYAYSVLPFVALAFGWSTGALVTRGASRARRVTAATLAALALCANAWAQHQDALGMRQSGDAAGALMAQLLPRLRELPPESVAVLVDPPGQPVNYSVFRVTGFRGVWLTKRQVREMTGRDDVRVRIAGPSAPRPEPCPSCVFFTLDGENRLVPMP